MRRTYMAVLAVSLVAILPSAGKGDPDTTGYLPCVKTFALPPATEGGAPSIGVRNICSVHIIAAVCATDAKTGERRRFSTPVNLLPGTEYSWSVHIPENYSSFESYACRGGVNCEASLDSHDPHCL